MGKIILVVEDEEVLRKFLRVPLSELGHEVLEAEDGEKAIAQLGRKRFDLIICDLLMPNKGGWQLMEEIKENPETRDIPVIVLTAKTEDKDRLRAYDHGVAYDILKPFTLAQLLYGIQMISNNDREEKLRSAYFVSDSVSHSTACESFHHPAAPGDRE